VSGYLTCLFFGTNNGNSDDLITGIMSDDIFLHFTIISLLRFSKNSRKERHHPGHSQSGYGSMAYSAGEVLIEVHLRLFLPYNPTLNYLLIF